jgi:hypothetical protein
MSSSSPPTYQDWGMPEPILNLDQTGPLVMGTGARRGDSTAGLTGPLPRLSDEQSIALQLAKKYAMEQSIKMVKFYVL